MQKKKSNFPPYPSDNVSQSDKKGLQWNSEWIKAVYFESSRDIVGNYDDNRRKFVNLRKYAAGKQDIDKYKPQLSLDGNTSQLNLNWNVSTPAPAIIDSLVGRLENQGLKLKIKSISPLASTEYDKEYRRLKAQALLIQKEAELNKLGVDISSKVNKEEASQLKGDREIELHLKLNFKDSYSEAMQKALDFVMESNRFPEIRRKVIRDAAVCNRLILHLAFDNEYDIKMRVADLVNFISDYTDYDDFRNCKWMGEYEYITLDEIAENSNFTEKELAKIAQSAATRYGNSGWDTGWDLQYYNTLTTNSYRPYGRFKIKVLNAEYRSQDKYQYEEVKEKGGGVFYRRVDLKDKNGSPKKIKDKKNEVVEKKINNIYKAKLIIGTDLIYDYGIKENQQREKLKGFQQSTDTSFSWVAFSADMYDMQNTSIMERLIPLVDQLCITRLQAQRAIANMTPQGVAVDVAAAAAVSNALGEEQITPRVLHDIYKATGTYYYSSVREDGEPISPTGNHIPIRDLPPPDLSLLMQLENRAASIIQDMSLVSGIPISTVGAPDVKALVGNEKIAAQNRNDTTRVLDDSYRNVVSRACSQIVLMVQDSIEYGGKLDDYEMAIGKGSTETLKFANDLSAMQFGQFIEVAPDIVEQAFFESTLQSAIAAGVIKVSDIYVLRDLAKEDIKSAARYMQLWEDKYAEEKAAMAQQAPIAQAQAQQQLAQVQLQMQKEKEMFLFNLEMRKMKAKYMLEGQQSAQDHKEKINEILVEGDLKIEQIETAMDGAGREEGGGKSKENYEKLGMPKASGVRLPSVNVSTKPNI